MAKKAIKLPEGYGAAVPEKGAAAYAKKGRRKRAARILRRRKKAGKVAGYGYGKAAV